MPVSVDASKTLISGVSSLTWANRPSSANASGLYLFTDVGASGTLMQYAGGRWRPIAGQAQLASLGAAVTGITNSETIVLQTLIPAGAWQTNDIIRLSNFVTTKTGTTDNGRLTIRVGTAGTTADTALTGLSAFQINTVTGVCFGAEFPIKLLSATSAQKVGINTSAPLIGVSTLANAAATTITDVSANAVYISVGLSMSGTTDTMSIISGNLQLITP